MGQPASEIRKDRLQRRIRMLIVFFIAALTISGITAIPLMWEINMLNRFMGDGTFIAQIWPSFAKWITYIQDGLTATNEKYPFIQYGTDWLAFAHIVIAIAFIGPLRDAVKNIWVIEFGMIACLLIIPTVLIFGPIRGIPGYWQIIDCSFGIIGFIPLWIVRKDIIALRKL